jgi:putative ABC transport system permease protein
MYKHFLITYYRNANSNKLHTTINYLGLSIAIAVVILIVLYVHNELTFDRFQTNRDRIFRITTTLTTPGGDNKIAITNTAFAFILKNQCPEIENIACIDIGGKYYVKYKDRTFHEENIRLATSGIFKLFSYQVLKGNLKTMLIEPNTTVLTESLSKKIFANEDPYGKTIQFNDRNYTVTGVIKDLPSNTDIKFSAILSSPVNGTENLLNWDDYYAYLLVNNKSTSILQNKVNKITDQTYKPLLIGDYQGISIKHNLQPLSDIHFNTNFLGDNPKGNKTNVYAFSLVAFLILVIASINYINLNIARAVTRSKEIMIRKISGSGKLTIIIQLIGESVITTIISLIISIFLVLLLIPVLNELTNKDFSAYTLTNLTIFLVVLSIVFIIGFIAAIYPVVYQLNLLKNKDNPRNKVKNGFNNISKTLVIFQFVLSIVMICTIIIVSKQIEFMKDTDLGFNKNQILAINLNFKNDSIRSLDALKQELVNNLKIDKIATGGNGTQLGSTGQWLKSINSQKNANNEDIQFISNMPVIDDNYLNLFEIKLIEGRNFSKNFSTDYDESVIVNKTYVKTVGWKNPIGQHISDNPKLKVIGVVNDFHFASLHNKIEPLLFRFNDKNPALLFLKISPNAITQVKSIWDKLFKDIPFEYKFVDENFDKQYRQDENQKAIFRYLSIVAILISCLGLYGLSSFFITQHTKEIGIRKVNGARITEVMAMLNKDFIQWVAIAFIIACPISWYAMHKWLESFAYKTTLSWWIFAAAGVIALVIALVTVSWQSYRAATRNPVESLRYE